MFGYFYDFILVFEDNIVIGYSEEFVYDYEDIKDREGGEYKLEGFV